MFSTPLLRRTALRANTGIRSFSTTKPNAYAKLTVIGRLAAEPELYHTSTGREMVRYALGTSHGPRDNRQTSWFRIACFDEGPRRDFLLSLSKGTLIHCEADARMNTYEDDAGKTHSTINLVQRQIEVLSRPYRPQEGQQGAADEPESGISAS